MNPVRLRDPHLIGMLQEVPRLQLSDILNRGNFYSTVTGAKTAEATLFLFHMLCRVEEEIPLLRRKFPFLKSLYNARFLNGERTADPTLHDAFDQLDEMTLAYIFDVTLRSACKMCDPVVDEEEYAEDDEGVGIDQDTEVVIQELRMIKPILEGISSGSITPGEICVFCGHSTHEDKGPFKDILFKKNIIFDMHMQCFFEKDVKKARELINHLAKNQVVLHSGDIPDLNSRDNIAYFLEIAVEDFIEKAFGENPFQEDDLTNLVQRIIHTGLTGNDMISIFSQQKGIFPMDLYNAIGGEDYFIPAEICFSKLAMMWREGHE
jgi:hypothetical protein